MANCENCGNPLTSDDAKCTFCASKLAQYGNSDPKTKKAPNSVFYFSLLGIFGLAALLRTVHFTAPHFFPISILGLLPWHLGIWVHFFGDPSPVGTAFPIYQNLMLLISGLLAVLAIRRFVIVFNSGKFNCPSTLSGFPRWLYSFGLVLFAISALLFIGKLIGGYFALPGYLFFELSLSLTKTTLFLSIMLAELVDFFKSKPLTIQSSGTPR